MAEHEQQVLTSDVRFSIVPEAVADFEQAGLTPNAVRLYAILDRYGNSEGALAVPGRKTLARRMGVSLDTLDRAKAELEAAGYLEVQRRTNATSVYTLRRAPKEGGRTTAGSRTDAATGSRTDAATVAAPMRPNREFSTENTPNADALGVAGRARDLLWEAMIEVIGWGDRPITSSARGEVNAALKQLREVDATPELIVEAAKAYRKEWPGVELSPSALAKWWPKFVAAAEGPNVLKLAEAWARNAGRLLDTDGQDAVLDGYRKKGLTADEEQQVRRLLGQQHEEELPIQRLVSESLGTAA